MNKNRLFNYENKLLILLSFIFGLVIFDRMALGFLVPFFDKELHLNNFQIGLLGSLLALAWAISGYLMGMLSDKTGKRKKYLVIAVIIFSICTFISGLAANFACLLIARVIMGFAEGPVLPLAQSIMINASTEKRKGFNMGFVQGFVNNILATLAPVVLVALATNFGWRHAFFIGGLPGIVLATLGFFFIREDIVAGVKAKKHKTSIAVLLRYRNVRVAILLSCCIMTWLSAQLTFMPKYLIYIKHLPGVDMAKAMSILGLGAIIWGIVIPALSDKFGRKLIVIFCFLLSVLMPLMAIYSGKSLISLSPAILLGASIVGCIPLVLATIPSETVPAQCVAQTLGLVMGIGELVGGFAAPAVAGWSADQFGLQAPFFIATVAALGGGLIALFLSETAPALSNKKIRMHDGNPNYQS
jgi:ACS family hexuronate transporter-like MFS transporter